MVQTYMFGTEQEKAQSNVQVDDFAPEFHRDIRNFTIERKPVGKKRIQFTAGIKRVPYPIDRLPWHTGTVPFGFVHLADKDTSTND